MVNLKLYRNTITAEWQPQNLNGYEPITTFWNDFAIADVFDAQGNTTSAIQDTYNRGLEYAKLDYKNFTELVMVLNHRSWLWSEIPGGADICQKYIDLYYEAEDEFYKLFENDQVAKKYYYRITD